MTVWTIRAEYDPEARVWWVADSDLPGIVADAETLEALAEKAGLMISDLLEIHEDLIADKSRLAGPHRLRIIAHHEHMFDVAA
jgi:predicted RNase H-like HicB family nuclease